MEVNVLQVWSLIIISAILVESVTNALKPIWDESRRTLSVSGMVSLTVGMIIALAANLNLFEAFGLEMGWPVLPQLFTGIIISRGANYVYDLLAQVQSKSNKQAE